MKKEIADLWVSALRSGDYEQGRDALLADDVYCCLGVLCSLAVDAGVITARHEPGNASKFDGYDDFPSHPVTAWAGLGSASGQLSGHKALSELNDDEKWTFSEIADHIEKHWEAL